MYCHQCGNKISDNAKFCGSCGKPVEKKSGEGLPEKTYLAIDTQKDKGKKSHLKLFATIFWMVIIVGSIVFMYLYRNVGSVTQNMTASTSDNIGANQGGQTQTGENAVSSQTSGGPSSQKLPCPANNTCVADPNAPVVSGCPTGYDCTPTETVVNSTPDLPSLIQEWQISTAYVECYWVDPDTHTWYEKESGSGLLVSFKSGLTVITNRHVVDSSQYGEATECDVGFHNDNGIYYAVTTVDQPAHYLSGTTLVLPDVPAYGNISFTADGTDVADLSNLKEETMGSSPNISLTDRAKTGHFSCDTTPTGEPIVVLGYPDYGAGAGTYTSIFSNLSITATEGIISGQDGIYFTTSAKLDPGNSGGVAIDENNDCYIGIPTAAIAGSMSSLGRILPANYAVTYGN